MKNGLEINFIRWIKGYNNDFINFGDRSYFLFFGDINKLEMFIDIIVLFRSI